MPGRALFVSRRMGKAIAGGFAFGMLPPLAVGPVCAHVFKLAGNKVSSLPKKGIYFAARTGFIGGDRNGGTG